MTKKKAKLVRALKLKIIKPLGDDTWNQVGPELRLLASATPKLMRAAYDARVAADIVGAPALKAAIAPDTKGGSADTLAYQAVLRELNELRKWGEKKGSAYKDLTMPGCMCSAISRVATQAWSAEKKAKREGRADTKGRTNFTAKRILVPGANTKLTRDGSDVVLGVKIRNKAEVKFLIARSYGVHRETLDQILDGTLPHGDVKIQSTSEFCRRTKKSKRVWYVFLAYEIEPKETEFDLNRVLVVHRGIRCPLYTMSNDGARPKAMKTNLISVRKRQLARHRDLGPPGQGARGHGTKRRNQSRAVTRGVIDRTTKTIFQQLAAAVDQRADQVGAGTIVIEDYGGIEPHEDRNMRRVLAQHGFSLYGLKQAIVNRAERSGRKILEVPSSYISSTCPVCENQDTRQHNTRTDVFHCKRCGFERPADWVAAFWLMSHSGADMSVIKSRLEAQKRLANTLK